MAEMPDPNHFETLEEKRKRRKRKTRRGMGGLAPQPGGKKNRLGKGTGKTSADMGSREKKGSGKTSADMGDREKKGTGLRSSDMGKPASGGGPGAPQTERDRFMEILMKVFGMIATDGQAADAARGGGGGGGPQINPADIMDRIQQMNADNQVENANRSRTGFSRQMRIMDQAPPNSRRERFRERQARSDANLYRAPARIRFKKGTASSADLDLIDKTKAELAEQREKLAHDRAAATQQRRDRTAAARARRLGSAPGLPGTQSSVPPLLARIQEITRSPAGPVPVGPEPAPAGPAPMLAPSPSFPPGPSRPWNPEPLPQQFDDPFGNQFGDPAALGLDDDDPMVVAAKRRLRERMGQGQGLWNGGF